MAITVTITPSKVLNNTDPVSTTDLNVGFSPTAAVNGTLDLPTQATFGATQYAALSLAAGATPVNIFPGVTGKAMRSLGIRIIRTSGLTLGNAVRVVIRSAGVSPTVIAYAALSDILYNTVTINNNSVSLPDQLITYTLTAMGMDTVSGYGIEAVIADVTNAPINGTTGTLTVAVTALYE